MGSRILFGFHAVTARLRTHPTSVQGIYTASARHDARMRDLAARAKTAGIALHTADDVLEGLPEDALLVVLDGVTDPHNLGACLRNADAFGAHAVIVPKDRAVGVNATVAKAASGAADTVPVVTVTNLARAIAALKERGVWVLGADTGGESIVDADLSGPIAWVLGAEGEGLRRLTRESCDRIVGIPIGGTVESLNVSVATGICLYATRAARSRTAR
ncbi:MAG: 23S rRNA (guanosine(2251)-2'-O)-methyltransferase RlmB [Vicinamibacteria bacterium]